MSIVVNLYAGPGTGKSTSAAYIFAKLKMAGVNAELVQEYAKEWAWQGREIKPADQLHIFGEQCQRESRLYGKASVIVTDSPLTLNYYFTKKFAPGFKVAISEAVDEFATHKEDVHVFLRRSKPYNTAGRYQTAEQAGAMDGEILDLLDRRIGAFITLDTDQGSLDAFVNQFIRERAICAA